MGGPCGPPEVFVLPWTAWEAAGKQPTSAVLDWRSIAILHCIELAVSPPKEPKFVGNMRQWGRGINGQINNIINLQCQLNMIKLKWRFLGKLEWLVMLWYFTGTSDSVGTRQLYFIKHNRVKIEIVWEHIIMVPCLRPSAINEILSGNYSIMYIRFGINFNR